jgi:hypothetical protein
MISFMYTRSVHESFHLYATRKVLPIYTVIMYSLLYLKVFSFTGFLRFYAIISKTNKTIK